MAAPRRENSSQIRTPMQSPLTFRQESSIKLREKNLHLNQEIHSKHQENCSLRDSFNSLTQQNLALSRDNRRLHVKVNQLLEDNTGLKQCIVQTSVNSGDEDNAFTRGSELQESSRLSPDSITPALNMSGHDTDNSEDSIDRSHADTSPTNHGPTHHLPPRPGDGEEEEPGSLGSDSSSTSSTGSLCAATEEASDRMDAIMDEVQRQNQLLRNMLLAREGSDAGRRPRALPDPPPSSPGRLHAMYSVGGRGDLPPEEGRAGSPAHWQVTGDQTPARVETGGQRTPNGEVWGSDQQPRPSPGGTASYGGAAPDWPRYPYTAQTAPSSNPSAGTDRPPHLFLSPTDVLDDDSKICPMCNLFFTKEVTQEMFESHVIAHFEDIDVGYEGM